MRQDCRHWNARFYAAAKHCSLLLRAVALQSFAIGCVCVTPALAGLIPTVGGVVSISGGGTASVTGPFTPFPNNSPAATSANFAAISKGFTSPTVPIDIVFNVTPTGGTTEYLFAEGIFNNTGVAWNDFHIQLGFGTGSDFVLADPALGLNFDGTPAPSSSDFSSTSLTLQTLGYSIGLIPSGSNLSLSFTIDVPDVVGAGPFHFTLREFPSLVPEPASVILLGSGAVCCGIALLRRRRK